MKRRYFGPQIFFLPHTSRRNKSHDLKSVGVKFSQSYEVLEKNEEEKKEVVRDFFAHQGRQWSPLSKMSSNRFISDPFHAYEQNVTFASAVENEIS